MDYNHPCMKCKRIPGDRESCAKYKSCSEWRDWFRSEWQDIQLAFKKTKEPRKKK